jgi:ribonuclease HII
MRPTWAEERRLMQDGHRLIAGIDEVGRGPLAGPVVAAAVILDPTMPTDWYEEIDDIGISLATRAAMARAVASLTIRPDYLLIDAVPLTDPGIPFRAIIHGDATCRSIAAASIVAKVYRDRLMVREDASYQGYGFARHKGYPTPEHLERLSQMGPCPIHRRSFAPVSALL